MAQVKERGWGGEERKAPETDRRGLGPYCADPRPLHPHPPAELLTPAQWASGGPGLKPHKLKLTCLKFRCCGKFLFKQSVSLDSTKNRKNMSNVDHISSFVHVSSEMNYNSSHAMITFICTISGADCCENAFGFSARVSSRRNRF